MQSSSVVPPATKRTLAPCCAVFDAAPALIAAWALVGYYASLGPALARTLCHSKSPALGGLALFVFAMSGTIGMFLTLKRTAQFTLVFGTAALVVGVALTMISIEASSSILFFAGTAIAGAGFGAAFQGAIRSVVPLAAAHERAGVLSILYAIAYLAMGVPAVLGGFRVVHGGGIEGTAHEYGLAVMLLAAVALVGTSTRRSQVAADSPCASA